MQIESVSNHFKQAIHQWFMKFDQVMTSFDFKVNVLNQYTCTSPIGKVHYSSLVY